MALYCVTVSNFFCNSRQLGMYLNIHHRSPSPPPPYSPEPLACHTIEDPPRYEEITTVMRSTEPRPRSTLTHGRCLKSGQELKSGNGRFRLCMQYDGNLVLYSGTEPIWSSRTHIKGRPPYTLAIQEDNQLCIRDAAEKVTWTSKTLNEDALGAWAKLRNNGNFVIYGGNGKTNPIWCTGTYLGRKALECYQGSGLKVSSPRRSRTPFTKLNL